MNKVNTLKLEGHQLVEALTLVQPSPAPRWRHCYFTKSSSRAGRHSNRHHGIGLGVSMGTFEVKGQGFGARRCRLFSRICFSFPFPCHLHGQD